MKLEIRSMRPEDMDGKSYVHWKSWQETYRGLVDADYLSRLTLEKCQQITRRWPDNLIVAELDSRIVGFAGYGPCRTPDAANCGEVFAIYILKEAQGLGIGRKLMDAAMAHLTEYDTIVIQVLKGNSQAFGFYEHYGFRYEGVESPIMIGTPNTELQMTYRRIKE